MCCTVKSLDSLHNRCRNVGGKLRCHNISGIMQNMSVVPGGKLYFFLQHLYFSFIHKEKISFPVQKNKRKFNYLVYTKGTLLLTKSL